MGSLIYNISNTGIASFRSLAEVPIQSCKIYFTVIQLGSGTPSDTNIRNFETRTSLQVTHHGKNFLTPEYNSFNGQSSYTYNGDTWACSSDGIITFNSGSTSTGRSCFIKERTTDQFILPQGEYILTGRPIQPQNDTGFRLSWTKGSSATIQGYDEGAGTPVTITDSKSSVGVAISVTKNFTSNSAITVKPMIRLSQDNDTWQPYVGTTYNIDWSSSAIPIIGGYIDIISGTLVNTYGRMIFTGEQDWQHMWGDSTANGVFRLNSLTSYGYKKTANNSTRKCSYGNYSGNVISSKTTLGFYLHESSDYLNVRTNWCNSLGSNTHQDLVTQWKQLLASNYNNNTPLEIVYQLKPADYETYQLSPIQLQTFIGRNNILSDAWTQIDVSYPLIEANDMLQAKKRIFNNSYINNND